MNCLTGLMNENYLHYLREKEEEDIFFSRTPEGDVNVIIIKKKDDKIIK